MAFGQEVGRVLSDGRLVGRAVPFAKVFPSSCLVKKAVGLAARCVLEDIALDATLDRDGRLVAETNVRRNADNLGLNKDTVSKHRRRPRESARSSPTRGAAARWFGCVHAAVHAVEIAREQTTSHPTHRELAAEQGLA